VEVEVEVEAMDATEIWDFNVVVCVTWAGGGFFFFGMEDATLELFSTRGCGVKFSEVWRYDDVI
jgi:hypothetical protein